MLDLRTLIDSIGLNYDRAQDMDSPAQQLLRQAGTELRQWIPAGWFAQGSGGRGNTARVPWIAAFDPDETTTARDGMYVVYLFGEDHQHVFLCLAQGVTELVNRLGRKQGRSRLGEQATVIREALNGID